MILPGEFDDCSHPRSVIGRRLRAAIAEFDYKPYVTASTPLPPGGSTIGTLTRLGFTCHDASPVTPPQAARADEDVLGW